MQSVSSWSGKIPRAMMSASTVCSTAVAPILWFRSLPRSPSGRPVAPVNTLAGGPGPARTEGIFLDPTYTARALAGLIARVAGGGIKREDRTVFMHTGGLPGLFGHPDFRA